MNWAGGEDEEERGTERERESFGTDFTNKCRRLNPGMSQDGSLSLNHRLPAASAFHLAFASDRPFVPSLRTFASLPLRSFLPRPSSYFVLRGGASISVNGSFLGGSSAICHMPTQLRPSLFPLFFLSYFITTVPNFASTQNDQIHWNYKISQNRLIDENPCRLNVESNSVHSRARKICSS